MLQKVVRRVLHSSCKLAGVLELYLGVCYFLQGKQPKVFFDTHRSVGNHFCNINDESKYEMNSPNVAGGLASVRRRFRSLE